MTGRRLLIGVVALLLTLVVVPAASATISLSIEWPDKAFMPDRPNFAGRADNDEWAPVVELTLSDERGTELATLQDAAEGGQWWIPYPGDLPDLAHGERYKIEVWYPADGDESPHRTRWWTVDAHPPKLTLDVEPESVTSDTSPYWAGTSETAPGDRPVVHWGISKLLPEGGDACPCIAGDAPVVDGRWEIQLQEVPYYDAYHFSVARADEAVNATQIDRVFSLVPAPPAPPPLPPVPPLPEPQPEPDLTGVQTTAVRALRRAGLRRLLAKGVPVRVEAPAPGRIGLELFRQRGARAAARRPIAAARRTLTTTGTVVLRAGPRGKRALRRARRARLRLRVSFLPTSGAATSLVTKLTLTR